MLSASELSDRLARDAEAVCRHYLSTGHRTGNCWVVGDVSNSKGRSLYVHQAGLARLWSTVNLFHRAGERIHRELQRNEDAQRIAQREQDGSEVKSVELERHILEGITLLERRNAFEFMRDYAADLFETQTGSAWRPRTGSKVSHANMTAAMIDSRDFLSFRRNDDMLSVMPAGVIVLAGSGIADKAHSFGIPVWRFGGDGA
jgi:hypothetical protein